MNNALSLRRLRKAHRDESGAALLEFALIALPFLGLVLGMLEVGLIFWAGYELDNATVTASRLIKTGQAQKGSYDQAKMVSEICSHVTILPDCATKLELTVQSFTNFDCVVNPSDPGCVAPTQPYTLGAGSVIELVTSSYEWPLFNFATVALLANRPNYKRLIQSAAVFQNEPFP